MITVKDKNKDRKIRHARVRNKVSGTAERPRLNVYRSLNNIYAQVIDDVNGVTIASASTLDKDVIALANGKSKSEQAKIVGEVVAKRAIAKNISDVVFDRGGYLYTGRIQALADGAREAGLKF
ncbi:MAG: 50S ribosomal protein L18 [Candidatus Gastranaerophilales bacterium]|nr:50S ribosomal protein L18 [Clostridia bacterium]MBQ8886713.1 50S ribosomal protein L18 [Candidatus Gastranaerophilales bacterium]